MEKNSNFILAIVLSLAVIFGWQMFYMRPIEKARQQQAIEAQKEAAARNPTAQTATPSPATGSITPSASVSAAPAASETREAALSNSQRVKIDSPSLLGSLNLKGGRIDDVVLRKYTVTVDPNSEKVVLLSPSGSPVPFYATFGWLSSQPGISMPGDNTVWQQEGEGALSPAHPVVLKFDNGAGLIFRRTVTVDDRYMFTISDEIENRGSQAITASPFAQVARLTEPKTSGYSVLHEGLVGVLGGAGLKELTYPNAIKNFDAENGKVKETIPDKAGWLGFTDQYWAAVLVPDQTKTYEARLFGNEKKQFYTDYLEQPVTVGPGEKQTVSSKFFAGAKEVQLLNEYEAQYKIDRFNKLIDWGWFSFLTHPMFALLDFFYKLVGNFGIAILIVTVLVKLAFFPLANKSYVSMNKMKALQPEMKKLQERFKDDKARQQQALMELYKKEKVNPMAGCLPILIQIPVFFSLYKVLLVTIEMRHAPFVGWIKDLSAPDPTTIFNLFGLIHWTPPEFLMLGVLPILMGISMWVQMRLNPTPPDPVQQQVFMYMPVIFTFMLAHFPAGLVLYWTWNNLLSFTQQAVIMKRQGSDIDVRHNLGIKTLPSRLQKLPGRIKNGRTQKPAE